MKTTTAMAPITTAVLTIVLAVACGDDETTGTSTQSSSTGNGTSGSSTSGVGGGSGGSSGTQTGGMGMGGGSAEECNACAQMVFNGPGSMCWEVFGPCMADATCGAWFNCNQSCQGSEFNAACFDACNADAASAQTLYQPVLDCLCSACGSECAPACN